MMLDIINQHIKDINLLYDKPTNEKIFVISNFNNILDSSISVLKPEEVLENIMNTTTQTDGVAIGGILIGWQYNIGAIKTHNGVLPIKRQKGYLQDAFWDNFIPDIDYCDSWILNVEKNEINVVENWCKIIRPICKALVKSLDPSCRKREIFIAMPMVSDEVDIDNWNHVFQKCILQSSKISLFDMGLKYLENCINTEIIQYDRYHIVYVANKTKEESLKRLSVNISTYSNVSQIEMINSKSYIKEENLNTFDTISATRDVFEISDNEITENVNKELEFMWSPVSSTFLKNINVNTFLQRHSAFYGSEFWGIDSTASITKLNSLARAIFEILNEYGTQTAEVICSKVCGQDLINIALKDLLILVDELENNILFKKSMLQTCRESQLNALDIPVEDWILDIIPMIPCNFCDFEWKSKKPSGNLTNYLKLDAKTIDFGILVHKIIEHFDNCTTYTVAEELLVLFNVEGDPNAYFTAKVFLYLSGCEHFILLSKYGKVILETYAEDVNILVDMNINKVEENDKLPAKIGKLNSTKEIKSIPNMSIFKPSKKEKALEYYIEELDLTVRAYECLKRARINTVKDIVSLTKIQLSSVKNLGENCTEEIVEKLKSFELTLKNSCKENNIDDGFDDEDEENFEDLMMPSYGSSNRFNGYNKDDESDLVDYLNNHYNTN